MAAAKTISQFKSKLAGGGARPNLFEVSIPSFPSSISDAWTSGDNGEIAATDTNNATYIEAINLTKLARGGV